MECLRYVRKTRHDKRLFYCLDSCFYMRQMEIIYIHGWAFSREKKPLVFSVDNGDFSLARLNRPDVTVAYPNHGAVSLKSGFEIEIKVNNIKTPVYLRIASGKHYVEWRIDLKYVQKGTGAQKRKRYMLLLRPAYIQSGLRFLKENGLAQTHKKMEQFFQNDLESDYYHPVLAYAKWIADNEQYSLREVRKNIHSFPIKPLISVIVPVYNVAQRWLERCIESVLKQYYYLWELCLVDDASTEPHIKTVLEKYKAMDNRIKVIYRRENGHISRASNTAIEMSQGEYIALLDNDDELSAHALYEVVKLINIHPDAEFIYSDEDKLSAMGIRKDPHFKTEWAPDTLMSCNYITHLSVIKKQLVETIGGFRVGYEGAQDYDLFLRATEQTTQIYHIPKILYHWRMIKGSTSVSIDAKGYAYQAAHRALTDALQRRGANAKVISVEDLSLFHVTYTPKPEDFVSIIIATRDQAPILAKCLESIYSKTEFTQFEVIVADNGSEMAETEALFKRYSIKENFRIIRLPMPFNYSKINNAAAKEAKGNLLLFLNNDTEVISPFWIEEMAGQASRAEIGAVGAKLYYPNKRIQHCGVVMGLGGTAGHVYAGQAEHAGYIGRLQVNYNYAAVTAACMMVKKALFFQVGGFDETLAVALNDIDFCLKLVDAGYYNLCIPHVRLYHHESLSRGYEDENKAKLARFQNECKQIIGKWNKYVQNDPFYNPNLSLKYSDMRIKTHQLE